MVKILTVVIALLLLGCGQKEGGKSEAEKSKVEEAVKEALTKELRMYESTKQSLEKIEKEAQGRREKEKEVK